MYNIDVARCLPTFHAHANILMWIFHLWLPENWFEFGIFLNDFKSSTISAIQIQISFLGVEIAKNPEFNLAIFV